MPFSIPIWDQYVDFLTWALDSLASVFQSGGLAIVAFTIIIKTVIMPLTVQSIRSSKAMQDLQPKIKELQKKYGKDRQRMSQETMALYQQHRINPMASCLPMLLQIPIFLGLYNAILELSTTGAGFWNNSFLWIPDLAQPDPIHLLPILAAVFQLVQTRMMRPYKQGKITDPQQAMMNSMMNIMPLTVILFGWGFAAGPVIYWAVQSIYSVVQQWFITGWGSLRDWFEFLPELPEHRRLGYRPPRSLDDVVVVSGEGAPRQGGVMGWIQGRMEEAQRQADARTGAARAPVAASTADAEAADGDADTAPAAPSAPTVGGGARRKGTPNRAAASARAAKAAARASDAGSGTGTADGRAGAARPAGNANRGGGTGNGRAKNGAVVIPRGGSARGTAPSPTPTATANANGAPAAASTRAQAQASTAPAANGSPQAVVIPRKTKRG